MKKNRMMRLASILLVCVLLSTSVISGTFAKYVSSGKASDTATVAKWSVTVNGTDIAGTSEQELNIDLFTTIADDDNPAGGDDANVEGTKIIAPGTGGQFSLEIINDSQVAAEYGVTFTVSETSIPLEFKVNDGSWSETLTAVTTTNLPMDAAGTDEDEGKSTVNVQWRWAFERGTGDTLVANNNVDTTLGKSPASVTVTATITATQKD